MTNLKELHIFIILSLIQKYGLSLHFFKSSLVPHEVLLLSSYSPSYFLLNYFVGLIYCNCERNLFFQFNFLADLCWHLLVCIGPYMHGKPTYIHTHIYTCTYTCTYMCIYIYDMKLYVCV